MIEEMLNEKSQQHLGVYFFARQQRQQLFDFAREVEAIVAGTEQVQRLDRETIAAQHHAAFWKIRDGKRPHAVQFRETSFAELILNMQNHFGVGIGLEAMSQCL